MATIMSGNLEQYDSGQRFKNRSGVIMDIIAVENNGELLVRTIENGDESIELLDRHFFDFVRTRYGFEEVNG